MAIKEPLTEGRGRVSTARLCSPRGCSDQASCRSTTPATATTARPPTPWRLLGEGRSFSDAIAAAPGLEERRTFLAARDRGGRRGGLRAQPADLPPRPQARQHPARPLRRKNRGDRLGARPRIRRSPSRRSPKKARRRGRRPPLWPRRARRCRLYAVAVARANDPADPGRHHRRHPRPTGRPSRFSRARSTNAPTSICWAPLRSNCCSATLGGHRPPGGSARPPRCASCCCPGCRPT